MAKLWVFGDSFTAGAGCLKDNNGHWSPSTKAYRDYIGLNNEDEILTWPMQIANHYDLELKNISLGGWSNESIFDGFFKNIQNIGADDIVIIGLTYFHRFDIKTTIGIQTMSINRVIDEDERFLAENNLTKDGLLKIVTNRANEEFVLRLIAQIDAIKYLTDKICKKCLMWCHDPLIIEKNKNAFIKMYSEKYDNFDFFKSEFSISNVTNRVVEDGHFGIEGHNEFTKILIRNLEEPK